MELSRFDSFEIKGEWWRSDGAALTKAFESAPKRTSYGLDDGLAILQGEQGRRRGQDQDHACLGTLRYTPESGLQISLLGASGAVFGGEGSFILHGLDSSGRPCSLLDCFVANLNASFPSGFTEVEIVGSILVHGAHLEGLSELRFDTARVALSGLRELLSSPSHGPDGKAILGLGGNATADEVVQLDDGTLNLSIGWRESHGLHRQIRERFATARFELEEPIDYNDWGERWIYPLAQLVSFSTGAPARVESFGALIPAEAGGATTPTRTTEVAFVHRQGGEDKRKLREDRLLVNYAGQGAGFTGLVQRWWRVQDKLAGAADFLFGALGDSMTVEPRLVTLASVAEAYHRAFHDRDPLPAEDHEQWVDGMLRSVDDGEAAKHYEQRLRYANEFSQQERITEVLKRAGTAIDPLGKKPGRLARYISETRNYFVHLPVEKPKNTEGHVLFRASRLLVIALEANLLLDLDIEASEVAESLSRKYGTDPVWMDLWKRGAAWPKRLKTEAL